MNHDSVLGGKTFSRCGVAFLLYFKKSFRVVSEVLCVCVCVFLVRNTAEENQCKDYTSFAQAEAPFGGVVFFVRRVHIDTSLVSLWRVARAGS